MSWAMRLTRSRSRSTADGTTSTWRDGVCSGSDGVLTRSRYGAYHAVAPLALIFHCPSGGGRGGLCVAMEAECAAWV